MKKLIIKLLLVILPVITNAQGINWKSINAEDQQMAY